MKSIEIHGIKYDFDDLKEIHAFISLGYANDDEIKNQWVQVLTDCNAFCQNDHFEKIRSVDWRNVNKTNTKRLYKISDAFYNFKMYPKFYICSGYDMWTRENIIQWAKEGDKRFIKVRKEMKAWEKLVRTFTDYCDGYLIRIIYANIDVVKKFCANAGVGTVTITLHDDESRGLNRTMIPQISKPVDKETGVAEWLTPFMLNEYPHL